MRDVILHNKSVAIHACAFTVLIFEDSFKGRRFLQDTEALLTADTEKIKIGVITRLFWSMAKTADNSIPDAYKWSKDFEISEMIEAIPYLIEEISETLSTNTSKKVSAAAPLRRIFQGLKFWHSQQKTG